MEVSIVRGYPHSWMVYFMENIINMNDLRVPYFRKPHIYIYIPISRTIQTISGDIQKIAS